MGAFNNGPCAVFRFRKGKGVLQRGQDLSSSASPLAVNEVDGLGDVPAVRRHGGKRRNVPGIFRVIQAEAFSPSKIQRRWTSFFFYCVILIVMEGGVDQNLN